MKKFKLILITFIALISLEGCQKTQTATTLSYEQLAQKQEYLLNLTGNKVLMYHFNNLPLDKNYEIVMTYEVYRNGEKIKDELITATTSDGTSEKDKDIEMALNIQEDKIRYLWGEDGGYSSGSFKSIEKIDNRVQSFLTQDIELTLGSDIYIYHAHSGNSTILNLKLGKTIQQEEFNKVLTTNETNIFIKLSFKEV